VATGDIVPLVGARHRERLAGGTGALDVELTADDVAAIERAMPHQAVSGDPYEYATEGDPRQRARRRL